MDKDNVTLEFSLNQQHEGLLDTSKYSGVSQNANDILANDHSSRVNKTDDVYKDIVDRINRSREQIESMNKPAVNDNNPDLRTKTEPDSLTKTSLSTFQPIEKKNFETQPLKSFSSPIINKKQSYSSDNVSKNSGGLSTTKHDTMSNQKQSFKSDTLEKVQRSSKTEEGSKASKQSKNNLLQDKKLDLIFSDDDDDKDGLNKALVSSNKKSGIQTTSKLATKKPDVKTLKKSRSPTKPETPKIKPVTKAVNTNQTKNIKYERTKNIAGNQSKAAEKNEQNDFFEEKYIDLKIKSKEMRNVLQEYMDKCNSLEDALNEKDQQLGDYQHQLRQSQNERIQSLDTLREFAKKEELWIKTERELRSHNAAIEEAESQQKKRLDGPDSLEKKHEHQSKAINLQIDKMDAIGDSQLREQMVVEQTRVLETLRVELDSVRKESKWKDNRIIELESVNNFKIQEFNKLKEQIDSLERVNRSNSSKIEELKENKLHLEEKINKLKKKHEDERSRFQQEKQKEIEAKKDKIKKLKADLKQGEALLQKLSDEKKILELEVEKQANVNATLERTLVRSKDELIDLQQQQYEFINDLSLSAVNTDLKAQNEEIFKNYQNECEKTSHLQSEVKKLTKQLKQDEEKLDTKEKESIKIDEMVNRLRNEVKLLLEENAKGRDYITRLESSIETLKSRQEDEIEKIEVKINELDQQLQNLKEENTLLKSNEIQVSRELQTVKDERDRFRKESKALKQVNLALEKDFNAVDQKVREFMNEKEKMLQGQHEKALLVKSRMDTKLKILEDIQTLLRNHRLNYKLNAE